jgi:predicted nucleic acid-binding protein
MLKIYLDNCCYGRPFDDLIIGNNRAEATAKMFIQSLVKYKSIELYYSFMSQAELDEISFEDIKEHILDFIETNATAFVGDDNTDAIKAITVEIMKTGIKIKDATHLACAIFAKCDYFITTDKRVINHRTDKIKIVNPIEFVRIWRETE